MKKYVATGITALLLHNAGAFAFSFSDSMNIPAKHAANTPVSQQQIQRLTQVIDLVQKNYIQKIDEKKLFDSAIGGMIRHLDPHSDYLDKKNISTLETTISGEFAG